MAPSSITSTPTKSGRSQLGLNGGSSGRESPMAPAQLCSATPLLEDWLFKQSSMVDTVVTKRWGVLYLDYFALFRKPKDSKPSKVIPLIKCTLSREVETSVLKVRKHSRNTVWALARGEVEEQQLHHFTITPSKGSPITICFGDLAKAQQWLSLVSEASTNSKQEGNNSKRRWEKRGIEGGSHSRKTSLVDDAMLGTWGSEEGTSPNSAPASRKHMDAMLREEGESSDLDVVNGIDGRENSSACLADNPNCHLTSFTKRWRSVQHVNGVAVYVECSSEHDPLQGETKMMSVPVACTPEACFRAIMLHGFDNYSVLESVDAHTTVLYHRRPAGICTSSRDCVLLRTWRRDVDGSYIILLQDTEHPAAPGPSGELIGGTVRAKVHAAGFIIAPCAPEYINQTGRSTECLVTAVAQVDLGGWLSPRCWLGRWLASSSLDTYTTSSWVQGLVSKVITLRDLVEQDRFLRKPFEDAFVRPKRPGAIKAHSSAASLPGAFDTAHLTPSAYSMGRTQSFAPARAKSMSAHGGLNGAPGTPSTGRAGVGGGEDDQMAWVGGTLAPHFWAQISAQGFKVRGGKYLVDRKKVPAAEPIFGLASVDIVKMRKPCFHIARHLPSIRYSTAPFTFLVNIMVPSTPFLSLVVAWSAADPLEVVGRLSGGEAGSLNHSSTGPQSSGCEEDEYDSDQEGGSNPPASPFDLCVARFLAGTDDVRNGKFKLIPRIAEGSWVIKQSVGTTPVILGRKLSTQYHRGSNYMEVDIDIGSSTVAASVVNLVYGATKSLVIDMAVLFEGQAEDELPEQLLGTVRLDHMDLGTAPWLNVERGVVTTSEPPSV